MHIGNAIARIMAIKHLNTTDMSELTGLGLSMMSLIANNKRKPSLSSLEAIANGLGVSATTLIGVASMPLNDIAALNSEMLADLDKSIKKTLTKARVEQ